MNSRYTERYDSFEEIKYYGEYIGSSSDPNATDTHVLNKFDKLLLSSLKAGGIDDKQLKFVELGCEASCRIYFLLKRLRLSGIDKYYGVDLSDVIKLSHIEHNEDVILTDDVFNIKEENIDVFYTNAVLNCLINPYDSLTHILNMSPELIHIHRIPCTTSEEFATIQLGWQNPPSRSRTWFFNNQKLINLLDKNNYEMIYFESEWDRTLLESEGLDDCSRNNFIFRKVK